MICRELYTERETTFIYKLKFPSNMCYIGKTTNMEQRLKSHLYSPNPAIKEHMDKHGYEFDDIEISIERVCLFSGSAKRIEDGMIRRYNELGIVLNRRIPKKNEYIEVKLPTGKTDLVRIS